MDTINADSPSEPAVAENSSAGQDFMKAILSGQQPVPQPAVPPQPVPQPAVPPQPAPQPAVPPQPAPQPAVPPPPPQVDYSNRYAPPGEQPQELSPVPELPPEPQLPATPDGQQIPNAAFAAMRAGYGQLRHTANELRDKYNHLVEDTKKFQGEKAEFATQLNAKDAEIRKLQDEIGRMDLSRSPEFQEKYDAPIRAATDEVTKLLLANGMQQDDAVSLAREIITSDPQSVPDKIANLPTHVQGMIMYQAKDADSLWTAREQALADWRQSAEGLAAVAARGSAIVDAQRTSQLADKAIGIVKGLSPEKGLPPAFQVTDPAFVADRDAKERLFRSWVQNAPEDQKMAAMFEGFMAPKTYEMVDDVFRENAQLKQMLYAKARVDSPPIAALRMPAPALRPPTAPPAAPPAAPQAPTVQQNGWSVADAGSAAQAFAQQIVDGMQGQRTLPVI